MQTYKQLIDQLAPASAECQSNKVAANRQKFDELLVWIDQNIDSPISLNDLLHQSGLPLNELSKQFRLHTKLSPLQFIKEFRQFKQTVALANQPVTDHTYTLFDPSKNEK